MLEGVKEPLQTSWKEIVLYLQKILSCQRASHKGVTKKIIPFCLLMNKLNIINYVLFILLMEGLQKESVPFLYD